MQIGRLKLVVLTSIFIGLGYGCGKPPSKAFDAGIANGGVPTPGTSDPFVEGGPGVSENLPMGASLAAFETYVYAPILSQYCSNCHAETFAPRPSELGADGVTMVGSPEEMQKAHKAFLSRANLEAFAGLDQTLPVTKMDYKSGGHNCWETEPKKCYEKMMEAMTMWLGELEAAGYKPTPVKYPNETDSVMFNTAAPIVVKVDTTRYLLGPVDGAIAAAPWGAALTDDPDGPIKSYLMSAVGTPAVAGNAPTQAQSITFNMTPQTTGAYFLWARVKTKAGDKQRFFAGIGAAAASFQTPGATTDWKWVQMLTGNNANNRTPMTANLTAGTATTVRIFHSQAEVKINQVVLTTARDDFNGEQISNQFFDVTVPLKVEGVEGASIVATVWKKTEGDGKKSLGVKELRIDSPVALRVKNIKPLINDLFLTNHGTYTIVDTVAGGSPEKAVIQTGGANSSIWIADLDKDKLSFSFEVLEIAK